MEQGNEGDEILLLSCRQIGCNIPDKVMKVGELTPEMLVEIISKSLALISNGDIQASNFP
ncbi:hypothetical protein EON65_57720 [archaeon]|nr:MAG: hypothetical protein EON65_57720 [archaeon]